MRQPEDYDSNFIVNIVLIPQKKQQLFWLVPNIIFDETGSSQLRFVSDTRFSVNIYAPVNFSLDKPDRELSVSRQPNLDTRGA
jgi:hypothetical protein